MYLLDFQPDALRQLRERAGLTTRQVGAGLGISPASVSRKERGDISIKPDEINPWLEVLGFTRIEFDTLVGDLFEQTRLSASPTGIPVIGSLPGSFVIADHLPDPAQKARYLERGSVVVQDAVAFCVADDSMAPVITPGSHVIAILEARHDLEPGDLVVATITNGDDTSHATIGYWQPVGNGTVIITRPNAAAYPPVVTNAGSIESVMRVIEYRVPLPGRRR